MSTPTLVGTTVPNIIAALDRLKGYAPAASEARSRIRTQLSVRGELARLKKALQILLRKAETPLEKLSLEHDLQTVEKVMEQFLTAYDNNSPKGFEKTRELLATLLLKESDQVKRLFFDGPQIV